MLEWVKQFTSYLRLVLKSWWVYIGLGMGAIRLFEKWAGIQVPLPHWSLLTAAAWCGFMAQWNAYKSLIAGRNSKVKNLASLIGEGRAIRQCCNMTPSWNDEWNAWQAKVEQYLRKEIGPQALTRFHHDTGLPSAVPVSLSYGGEPHPWFDRQIQNLVDIMDRIDVYA